MKDPNEMTAREITLAIAFSAAIIATVSSYSSEDHNKEKQGFSIPSLFNHNKPDGTPKIPDKYSAYSW